MGSEQRNSGDIKGLDAVDGIAGSLMKEKQEGLDRSSAPLL